MSKTKALYHIVFCTKCREKTIPLQLRPDVYRFINKEIRESKCQLIRIGGIENHIHMLINLNPIVALSDLVRKVKANTSGWLRKDPRFPHFKGWAAEYFAATIGPDGEAGVVSYINSQVEHHRVRTEAEEFNELYTRTGLPFDSRDLI